MMTLKEKINEYLFQLNFSEEDIAQLDASSVYVAQQIALYAHRNQSRLNGDNYYVHPYNVLSLYRKFTGITDDYFCVDLDLLVWECGIPYDGVQEVCLLHDVLEDTVGNMFMKKGSKPHEYSRAPYPITEQEAEERKRTEQMLKEERMKAAFGAFANGLAQKSPTLDKLAIM